MSLLLAGAGNGFGKRTQTAGTVINALIQPRLGLIARIYRLMYTLGSTAHTLTFLRPIGRTKFSAAGASGQTVVNIVEEPGVAGDSTTNSKGYPQGVTANLLAASDLVAIREIDGVTRLYTVSSRSSLAITLSANLVAGVAAVGNNVGGDLWMFGVLADIDPRTGLAHETLTPTISATNTYTDSVSGIIATHKADEPILVQSSNLTTAGSIDSMSFAYDPPVG